ncbi:unnamed protein product [Brachionus calyciflorus]|uniref:Endonuclease III homolog n=1 Tax=Brachionus calyciflorus TaxID=104777 RepID=A0A814R155_9BILA|nr:unnamed protein product [Brachionus calyciflorus]
MESENQRPKRKGSHSSQKLPSKISIKSEIIDHDEKENCVRMPQNSQLALKREPRKLKEKIMNLDIKAKDKIKKFEYGEEEPGLKKIKWEPSNWHEQFEMIKQMRSGMTAPVDSMGCDTLSSIEAIIDPKVRRYQCLIALMLSSQTKDEVTAKAVIELQKFPLEIQKILSLDEEKIASAIYPASFYKRKAQYIKRTSQILKDKYDCDIPDTIEDLCKLPGVGPKMAYLAMSCAWGRTVGIGVDTHVHRISNRLGWTKSLTKTPEHTRKELEEWMPESLWYEVNHLLVGFGQETCRPVGPKCSTCLCKNICPTGKESISKPKKSKSVKIEIDQ